MGGKLRHGDPGVRLIEATEGGLDYFTTVPASFQAQDGQWRIAPYYHLFGSDELSQRSPVFQSRMPQPYIKLNRRMPRSWVSMPGRASPLATMAIR
ncbi:NADH dehydrogenase I chain G [Salmonella enterica subsp. enterica]|uniref:NADH dehydrogenase I chain G n=1 Tax=Salmonella enterica I TaxID=59201 RepID=A0A3S5DCF3_SALET|nr:NADH dehydrogenase I chain G [Salmonella enterica subsp. enterica]